MFGWQCGLCFTYIIILMAALWLIWWMLITWDHTFHFLWTRRDNETISEQPDDKEGHRLTVQGWRGLERKNEQRRTDADWIPWRLLTREESPGIKSRTGSLFASYKWLTVGAAAGHWAGSNFSVLLDVLLELLAIWLFPNGYSYCQSPSLFLTCSGRQSHKITTIL